MCFWSNGGAKNQPALGSIKWKKCFSCIWLRFWFIHGADGLPACCPSGIAIWEHYLIWGAESLWPPSTFHSQWLTYLHLSSKSYQFNFPSKKGRKENGHPGKKWEATLEEGFGEEVTRYKQLNKSRGKAFFFAGKLCQHVNCKVTREENPRCFLIGNVFLWDFWVCRKSILTWRWADKPFPPAFGKPGSVGSKAGTNFGREQSRRGSWAGPSFLRWPACQQLPFPWG